MTDRLFMTVGETARWLGCCTSTVRKLIREKRLIAYSTDRGETLVAEEDARTYLETTRREAPIRLLGLPGCFGAPIGLVGHGYCRRS